MEPPPAPPRASSEGFPADPSVVEPARPLRPSPASLDLFLPVAALLIVVTVVLVWFG